MTPIGAIVENLLYEAEDTRAPTQSLAADNYIKSNIEGIMTGINSYVNLSKEESEKLQRDIEDSVRQAYIHGMSLNPAVGGGEGVVDGGTQLGQN